jgi:predicted flap endonuclease-1-like 5' DNA nuclease
MKGWVWVLLGVLLGIVIGWLLRSIAAKRQVARARKHHVETAELERLRGRVANLEPVAADRDQLQAQLDECRARAAATPEPDQRRGAAAIGEQPGDERVHAPPPPVEESPIRAPTAPDVSQAKAILGRAITLDDLKAIEGIGPKIESLCHGIGIRTWFDLSTTEASLLRTMLADAGSRFATHDPSSWPDQAALLAAGRWDEFKTLTDGLRGGRAAD